MLGWGRATEDLCIGDARNSTFAVGRGELIKGKGGSTQQDAHGQKGGRRLSGQATLHLSNDNRGRGLTFYPGMLMVWGTNLSEGWVHVSFLDTDQI